MEEVSSQCSSVLMAPFEYKKKPSWHFRKSVAEGRLRKMEGQSYMRSEGCESYARKVLGLDCGLSPPQLMFGVEFPL